MVNVVLKQIETYNRDKKDLKRLEKSGKSPSTKSKSFCRIQEGGRKEENPEEKEKTVEGGTFESHNKKRDHKRL